MIVFLDGLVDTVGFGYVDLAVQSVGYRVYVTDETMNACQQGQEIRLYTYQHVREDAVLLYGFKRREERAVFERLITVSGVGPRVAIQMLGALAAESLVFAIQSEDAATLCTLPGIGKKTAQRIILDLKDKLGDLPMVGATVQPQVSVKPKAFDVSDDLTTGLIALGYRPKEATNAVQAVLQDNDTHTVESGMKAALKWLYEHQNDPLG